MWIIAVTKLFQFTALKVASMTLSCLKKIHETFAATLADMLTWAIKAYKRHTQIFVSPIRNQKVRALNPSNAKRTRSFHAQEFQSKTSFDVARFLGLRKAFSEGNTRITEKHGILWQVSSTLEGQKGRLLIFRKDV